MGLDVSHDCWHGAYSAFNRFRSTLADAIGVDLDSMEGFGTAAHRGRMKWFALKPDPLLVLLDHSDCDGTIAKADCAPLAARLRELAATVLTDEDAGGHHPGAKTAALTFAAGLDLAVEAGEDVRFR